MTENLTHTEQTYTELQGQIGYTEAETEIEETFGKRTDGSDALHQQITHAKTIDRIERGYITDSGRETKTKLAPNVKKQRERKRGKVNKLEREPHVEGLELNAPV